MARYYNNNPGYTSGGIDVSEAVNLFFKGVLLFPVFVLTIFIGLTMVKNILYNGLPLMNGPSEEQREVIRENDSNYRPGSAYSQNSLNISPSTVVPNSTQVVPVPNSTRVLPSTGHTGYQWQSHGVPSEHYDTDTLQEPVEEAWITSIEEDPFN